MIDSLEKLLVGYWLMGHKESFFVHFMAFTMQERTMLIEALQVFADSESDSFRQAAVDIPIYIQSQKLLLSNQGTDHA